MRRVFLILLCYSIQMLKLRSPHLKAMGALAIVTALLSAGFVIAQQCHSHFASSVTSTTSTTSITHSHHQEVQVGAHAKSLLSDFCTGALFLVLILGAKTLLNRALRQSYLKRSDFFARVLRFMRPPNLAFALSQSQLGIYRI